MTGSALFERVFAATIAAEGDGKLDLHENDRGNWTGGAVGEGVLKGSKFGVSAKSYPGLDIANLTLRDAQVIYWRDYFIQVRGTDLPAPLALLVFDAAVNSGVFNASCWLQAAVGTKQDGDVGDLTIAAVGRSALMAVCAETVAQRLSHISKGGIWYQDTLGLSRRVIRMAFLAANFPLTETV